MRNRPSRPAPWVQAVDISPPFQLRALVWCYLVVIGVPLLAIVAASTGIWILVTAATVALAIIPMARLLRVGARSRGELLIVGNYFRTHRIPRFEIAGVAPGRPPTPRELHWGGVGYLPHIVLRDGRTIHLIVGKWAPPGVPGSELSIATWLAATEALGYASPPT